MSYKIKERSWKAVRADIFAINNNNYPCIVDYYSRFSVMKQVAGFISNELIKACLIMFSKYGLPSKNVSDVGTNICSEKFENLCR